MVPEGVSDGGVICLFGGLEMLQDSHWVDEVEVSLAAGYLDGRAVWSG